MKTTLNITIPDYFIDVVITEDNHFVARTVYSLRSTQPTEIIMPLPDGKWVITHHFKNDVVLKLK